MVENGVLDVIFREIKHRFHSLRIKREIGLLLGNLALEESAHEGMVEQGNTKSWSPGTTLELQFIANIHKLAQNTTKACFLQVFMTFLASSLVVLIFQLLLALRSELR